MRYLSIATVLGLAVTGLLLAENKKTVKAPKGANEYAVKKNLKNGVELGLKMKRKGVAGDPLMLKVSVANKGKKVVRHGPTDAGYRDVRMKIVRVGGKDVPFTRFGKQRCGKRKPTVFTKFNPKPVKPGETYSVTFNLSLLFDLTLSGTYRVSVETEIYPLDSRKNSTEFTMKVSELEFKLFEPRPLVRARTSEKRSAHGFEQLTLKIATAAKGALPLEPIPITITLLNATRKPIRGHEVIAPNAGYLEIYVATGDQPFEKFPTADWVLMNTEGGVEILKPGFRRTVTGFLYYAHAPRLSKEPGRYLLRAPGVYRIKAELKDRGSRKKIESNVIKVEATKPIGDDAAAYEFLKGLKETKDKGGTGRPISYYYFLLRTGRDLLTTPRQRKVLAKQEEFISKFPNSRYSRYLYYSLGSTYCMVKKTKRGMQLLEKAGGYDDFFLAPRSLGSLVEACLKQGDLDTARKHLATMRKRFPGNPSINEAASHVGKVASDTRPANP